MPRASAPASPPDEVDLLFPAPPEPSSAALAAVDEETLRKLVRYHHELLRRSSVGDLFPSDSKRFATVVEKIASFVVASVAGQSGGVQSQGLTWFRTRHLPLTIDETARNVWLAALLATLEAIRLPSDAELALWNWLEALSIRAITRRTMVGQPRRYPFSEAPAALSPFLDSIRRNARPV